MRNLRNEEEITSKWKGEINKPIVSICCITYNHELYIEDALEGFLIQETDFAFEILVHDDASTDQTANIIRKYEKEYPKIIKPIYQTENQYSKDLKMNAVFNFPRAQGEYIALCEGDDFWIASNKLKIQVQTMNAYPSINLSFHPAFQIKNEKNIKVISNHSNEIKIYTQEQVILGDGGFMPTASLLIKAVCIKNLPTFFFTIAPVGDYYLQILSSNNGALFIPEIASIYRVDVNGSWSISQKINDIRIKNLVRNIKALKELNIHFKDKNFTQIKQVMLQYILRTLLMPNLSRKEKEKLLSDYEEFIPASQRHLMKIITFIPSIILLVARKLRYISLHMIKSITH